MASARWTEDQLADYQARRQTGLETQRAFWPVIPAPWVRESNRDKFAPRQRVKRYRVFRQEIALRKVWSPLPGDLVVFLMPLPKSWPKCKAERLNGMPHEQVPDVDNLTKALLDACYLDDKHIWTLTPAKFWSNTPGIYIERREPTVAGPFTAHLELA